jgi:hypothetical protein
LTVSELDLYAPPGARWNQWQRHAPALGGFDFAGLRRELLDRDVSAGRKDELLAALIRCARDGQDDDARLAVIVCLLPGLRRIAGRYGDILGRDDAVAELVADLWEQLGTYDVARRPQRIAARLLAHGAGRLARCTRRERAWRNHIALENRWDAVRAPTSAEAEVDTITSAVRAGVLDIFDATLIEATRLSGVSLSDAAVLLGVTYEAAKKRRRRAEVTWLSWWAPELRPTYTSPPRVAA